MVKLRTVIAAAKLPKSLICVLFLITRLGGHPLFRCILGTWGSNSFCEDLGYYESASFWEGWNSDTGSKGPFAGSGLCESSSTALVLHIVGHRYALRWSDRWISKHKFSPETWRRKFCQCRGGNRYHQITRRKARTAHQRREIKCKLHI